MFKNKITIISLLLLFIISIGIVSASENTNKSITQKNNSDNKIKLDNTNNSHSNINNNLKNKKVFRIYHNKKYFDYYTITNKKEITKLKKNLKIGKYKVTSHIKKNKITTKNSKRLKLKSAGEMGCCSVYIQVNSSESIGGFRRDSTYAANIFIKKSKWNNKTIIKQYKTANTYFFHLITSSDGWIIGTGGADNPNINKKIEKLSETMVSIGKIKQSLLKKIQSYEKILGIGHYAIKDPKGNYAIVWKNIIKTGKLKKGEFISVPNKASYFRYGKFKKFDTNPLKAAIKIGATDKFGINRRDCTIFHLKYSKNKGNISVYGANDDGKLSGRHTSHLKDNIYFKNKYFSKNSLPKIPKMKLLGTCEFKL